MLEFKNIVKEYSVVDMHIKTLKGEKVWIKTNQKDIQIKDY